jgi:hypothetical protein
MAGVGRALSVVLLALASLGLFALSRTRHQTASTDPASLSLSRTVSDYYAGIK